LSLKSQPEDPTDKNLDQCSNKRLKINQMLTKYEILKRPFSNHNRRNIDYDTQREQKRQETRRKAKKIFTKQQEK
jgi:hypothetical protein